jgi:predicted enzyme involved in methoxymalonyl-ACP biosynthesis
MLRGLIETARGMGVRRLVGEYCPTAKNTVVADLYSRLGFEPAGEAFFVRDVASGMSDLITHIADVTVDGGAPESR